MPDPRKRFDLVMKGGITSGVAYPAAIGTLKDQYDFISIGGTSARAIAAAIAPPLSTIAKAVASRNWTGCARSGAAGASIRLFQGHPGG
jgi:hypothetical protein